MKHFFRASLTWAAAGLLAATVAGCGDTSSSGTSSSGNSASQNSSPSTEVAAPSTSTTVEAPRPATVDVSGWTVPSKVDGYVLLTNEDIARYGAEHGDYPQLYLVDYQRVGWLRPPTKSEVATFDAYGPINAHYTTIGRGDAQTLAFYVRDLEAFEAGSEDPTLVYRATGVDASQRMPPGCGQGSLVVCTAVVGDTVYGAQGSAAPGQDPKGLLAAIVATQ